MKNYNEVGTILHGRLQPAQQGTSRSDRRSFWARAGGTNWPGAGADPETELVIRAGEPLPTTGLVAPRRSEFSDLRLSAGVRRAGYITGRANTHGPCADVQANPPPPKHQRRRRPAPSNQRVTTLKGLSLSNRPTECITAIDLRTGEKWQMPHGDTPDVVRNHPKLKGLTIPKTGQGAASACSSRRRSSSQVIRW